MSPCERWQAVLSEKQPDRVPCDYFATPEVTERLLRDLRCDSKRTLWERLGIDKGIQISENVWHLGFQEIPCGGGLGVYQEVVIHPLAGAETVSEIERFPWPDPDWWDVDGFRARCEAWKDYPILGREYEPFWLYCLMRGMEKAMEDLIVTPEIAEAALERIFVIHESVFRRTLEKASDLIDLMVVSEDLGSQHSLLMSPKLFRQFFRPRMARMIELVHSYGVKVFHHNDGAIRPFIPELIDIGIDVLDPIQWRCAGMDREDLAADFGPDLVFHGGIDNQQTLPFGTPEDVRKEVAENIEMFSQCKGHIVCPCHNIQPNTPTENILALYEAVEEFG
jgi:uroporphyrinogen decarboxylase